MYVPVKLPRRSQMIPDGALLFSNPLPLRVLGGTLFFIRHPSHLRIVPLPITSSGLDRLSVCILTYVIY